MQVGQRQCDLLFPTPVFKVMMRDFQILNQQIIKEIEAVDWEQFHQQKGIRYEAGDTKAEDTYITTELVPSCKTVLDTFQAECNAAANFLTWDIKPEKTEITGFWAHITPPGEYTQPHAHIGKNPINHWSGVYYVKTPPNCGSISFWDDRVARAYEPELKAPGKVYALEVGVPATEGLMILFPSWLMHKVSTNLSDQTRISLSFNVALHTS